MLAQQQQNMKALLCHNVLLSINTLFLTFMLSTFRSSKSNYIKLRNFILAYCKEKKFSAPFFIKVFEILIENFFLKNLSCTH